MITVSDGQLATSATAIYTAPALTSAPQQPNTVQAAVSCLNTSSSTTETVLVTLSRNGGANTARRVARAVLAPNEQLFVVGIAMAPGDILKAQTTDASTVDYVVSITLNDMPFQVFTLDTNGAMKQNQITQLAPVALAAGSAYTATASNRGQTILLNQATGSVVTLPAATGTGNTFTFVVTTTVTSNNHKILAASTSDYLQGNVVTEDSGTATGWNATAAGTFNSIRMNGSTTGGFLGDILTFTDVATNLWQVSGFTKSTGTAATPFNTADS